LYTVFIKNNSQLSSAKEFETSFKEVMKPNLTSNKYNAEYLSKLDREMQKFNGKILVGDGAETNSEMTSATKVTKKSGSQGQKQSARGGSPGLDEVDEAAAMGGGQDDDREFDDDDQVDHVEMERLAKLKAEEQSTKELFRETDGTLFNPEKKFGVIEDNSLIYDNVTTSYPVNLPADYY